MRPLGVGRVDLCQQRLEDDFSQFMLRHLHGREWRNGELRQVDIIKAHHRQLVGNLDIPFVSLRSSRTTAISGAMANHATKLRKNANHERWKKSGARVRLETLCKPPGGPKHRAVSHRTLP